jgi:chemotaxis regulatin CheY-phosphate phosphatase CheZ
MTAATPAGGDLDATLGVLTRLISEIQNDGFDESRVRELVAAVRARPHLATLPGALLKAYTEITAVLSGIRVTRETIQHHALDQLRDTQERLNMVSSATESAAMEMLNGLDRTVGLVDRLAAAPGGDPEVLGQLRAELDQLFGHLQFQDITTQQLRGVMSLLVEVETRIARVADLFDKSLASPEETPAPAKKGPTTEDHNPDAVWVQDSARQAAIDAAFARRAS